MRAATMLFAAAGLALAFAGPASSAEEAGRYQFEQTDGGFVRMDTQTGQISVCTQQAGALDCKVAADERPAGAADVELMTRRIEALEKRVAELERGKPKDALPTEEEFERTMGFMERFFRRFMGVVQDLQQEQGTSPTPTAPHPDRT